MTEDQRRQLTEACKTETPDIYDMQAAICRLAERLEERMGAEQFEAFCATIRGESSPSVGPDSVVQS